MADEMIYGVRQAPSDVNVTLFPSSPTSNAPSDWQQIDFLPLGDIPEGASKRVALVVTGILCQVRTAGATPQRGVLEICLGLTSGLRSTHHRARYSLRHEATATGAFDGVPFTFIMVQQSAGGGRPEIIDPSFGATTNTFAAEFGLYARLNWNGDTPAYAASATEPPVIRDVQWFWADMDELEALGHVHADVGATSFVWTGTNAVGDSSQTWGVFHATYFKSPATPNLPTLEQGIHRAGDWVVRSTTKTNRQHPSGVAAPGELLVVGALGSFQQFETTEDPAYPKFELGVPSAVDAHVALAIRIDSGHLPWAASTTPAHGDVTEFYDAQPWSSFNVHEVSAPAAPVAIIQICCSTFTVTEPGASGFRCHSSMESMPQGLPEGFARVRGSASATEQESMPVMRIRQRPLAFSALDRARLHLVRLWFAASPPAPAALVSETSHAVFNRVHDQSISATKWSVPTPLELSLDPEAPLVGSLPSLPVQPVASIPVRVDGHRMGRIRGRVPYVRTWPNWIKPRRVLALSWGALSSGQGAALIAFLNSNRHFALAVPDGSGTVAVTQRGPFSSSRLPEGRVEVSVEVTELVFTA